MDLTLNPEEEAFRDEVRAWIADNHPGPAPGGGDQAQFEFEREWQRKLHAAGWAGISSPKEYGGRGATLIEQSIFGEELARAKAPRPANVLGLVMGGPVVIAHGTEEQKERFLEPILSAEEIWCQGFSEPESGSDLASLKTKAVPDDGGFRITGQKVWTTFAHEAKWCMLVARTDPEAAKHKGLTYFLLDMEQDEIEGRPLRQITGEAEFNECSGATETTTLDADSENSVEAVFHSAGVDATAGRSTERPMPAVSNVHSAKATARPPSAQSCAEDSSPSRDKPTSSA